MADLIGKFRRQVEDFPSDACARVNLGTALFQQGQGAEALVHYRKAGELKPEDPVVLYNLANTLRHLGQAEEAVLHGRKALSLKPPKVVAVAASLCLGECLKTLGLIPEAVDQYLFTLELDGRHGPAHYNLANILRDQGRAEESLEHYRLALEGQHDRALAVSIHVNWGALLESQGRLKEALEHYRQALDLDPGDTAAALNLARGLALKKTQSM